MVSDDVLDVLVRARARIADEEHWTRGGSASDAKGRRVMTRSRNAVRWCAHGSLMRESSCWSSSWSFEQYALAAEALDDAANDLYERSAPAVNDELGHAAVLHVFDRAVARQRERKGNGLRLRGS